MLNDDTGCLTQIIMIVLFGVLLGGFCVQYTMQFWASYIKGVETHVPFYACAVAGMFTWKIAVPVALFTWVLSFVL